MGKQAIETEGAPKAVGPYSQAIAANGFLFLSGQVPLDPQTGKLIDAPDIESHARRVMDNLAAVLEAGGSGFDRVVKATVYLADIADFAKVNAVYGSYFGDVPPARAAFQAGRLPLDARVEIEMIALLD